MTTVTTLPEALKSIISPCPTWCDKDHALDLEEGATLEQAAEHFAGGAGAILYELSNGRTVIREGTQSWNMSIQQQAPAPRYDYPAFIDLWVGDGRVHESVRLQQTSNEARELAAALVHYANLVDGIAGTAR